MFSEGEVKSPCHVFTGGRSEDMTGRLDFSLREHEGEVKT
jgi:hypothetical protein